MKPFLFILVFAIVISNSSRAEVAEAPAITRLEVEKEIPAPNLVGSCQSKAGKKTVLLFKQWHLDPGQITSEGVKDAQIPQAENQMWIYRVLADWIEKKKLKTVFVEGCEGEITRDSKEKFNGWSMIALMNKVTDDAYASIMTHVGMKLEAKYAPLVDTLCAEKLSLVNEQMLAFSDLRGLIGFSTRIKENAAFPEKQAGYVTGAIRTLKLSEGAKPSAVVEEIRRRALAKLDSIQAILGKRNDVIVEKIAQSEAGLSALVIGGLHASDLVKKLSAKGIACQVIEPSGYRGEEGLFERLRSHL